MLSGLIRTDWYGSSGGTPLPSPLVPITADTAIVNGQGNDATGAAGDRGLPFATATAALAAVWFTGTVIIENVNLTENITTGFQRLYLVNSTVTGTLTANWLFLYGDNQVFNRSTWWASPLGRSWWYGNISANAFWVMQIRGLYDIRGNITWGRSQISIGNIAKLSSTTDIWGDGTTKPQQVDMYNIEYIDAPSWAIFNQDWSASVGQPIRYDIRNIQSINAQNIVTWTDSLTEIEMDRVRYGVNVITQWDCFVGDQLELLRMTYCDLNANTLMNMSSPALGAITVVDSWHNFIRTPWDPIIWATNPIGQVTLRSSFSTIAFGWNSAWVVNQTVGVWVDHIDSGI